MRFVGSVGVNKTEQRIAKIVAALEMAENQTLSRAKVMMNNHLTKTFCDEIEMTLMERGMLKIIPPKDGVGRLWKLISTENPNPELEKKLFDGQQEEKAPAAN